MKWLLNITRLQICQNFDVYFICMLIYIG